VHAARRSSPCHLGPHPPSRVHTAGRSDVTPDTGSRTRS
jgi:hypothetical protein